MKFILYHWNTLSMNDIKTTLEEAGHEVDCIYYVFTDFDEDVEFENRIKILFQKKRYDGVLSFDFFQVISKVCNNHGIPYISWVWDSPQVNLYSKECANSCNYIFVFDKEVYFDLTQQGIKTVYYLPLAVNVERLDKINISKSEQELYSSDVSFVGALYDKSSLYDDVTILPDQLQKTLDKIVEKQSYSNGIEILENELTEDIWNEYMEYVKLDLGPGYLTSSKTTIFNRVFATKVSNIERTRIVSKLAELYDFKLYTGSNTSNMPEVNNQGYVDYFQDMPKVFKSSNININMTLRTIKTGIPLRIFDILGSGGFLITNYQEDLDLFFENGVDLVYYHNESEMFELIQYYNQHEEERKRIAKSGYEKVKKYHSYKVRMDYILDTVFYHRSEYDYMGFPIKEASIRNQVNDDEFKQLNECLWNMIIGEQIVNAYNTFTLFYRDHTEITQLQRKVKLEYECILKICLKELQEYGQCEFITQNNKDKECVLQLVQSCIEAINDEAKDQKENINNLYSMLCNGRITCLQVIEIILVVVDNPITTLNNIAEYMLDTSNYDKVIPFLIEAEESNPEDKRTIKNLVKILTILGEDEMAEEYREKL